VTLTVSIHDDSGEQEDSVVHVPDDDYLLVCTGNCYEAGVQVYPRSGTHVITIKGQKAKAIPPAA
jgi:hypothetical protein